MTESIKFRLNTLRRNDLYSHYCISFGSIGFNFLRTRQLTKILVVINSLAQEVFGLNDKVSFGIAIGEHMEKVNGELMLNDKL